MRVIISIVPLSVGIACLLGCSAEHVTAVQDSEALLSEGEPVPGDPWGVCGTDWTCSSHPRGGCFGWTEPGSCRSEGTEPCEVDVELYLIGCEHSCTTSADCPVPLSGDVVPTCSDEGQCYLACESGSCPNGYSCIAVAGHHASPFPPHMCMQSVGPEYWDPGPHMPEE